MNILNISFLLLAFAVGIAVVYMVVLILRRWYFNLSPKETASFALLMWLLGFVVASYLLGNLLYVFFSTLVIFTMFAWWAWRTTRRNALHKQATKAGVGVSTNERQ